MSYYVLVETIVLFSENDKPKQTRRGWLKADSLQQAEQLKNAYEHTGTAKIVTDVKDLEFNLNEIEGIPV